MHPNAEVRREDPIVQFGSRHAEEVGGSHSGLCKAKTGRTAGWEARTQYRGAEDYFKDAS
jgi:hypothetical protein